MSRRIILGSQSPRRKEILQFFSLPFEQVSPYFAEELVPFEGDPIRYTQILSQGKAASIAHRFPHALILTADTVVFKEGQIFNKPNSDEEALAMLKTFNGSWHSVFTSVTIKEGEREMTACEETKILFHTLTEKQLQTYHKVFKNKDKAGGYGVQMGGSIIVNRIEGCFYNAMGLPVTTTRLLLEQMGVDLWHYLA